MSDNAPSQKSKRTFVVSILVAVSGALVSTAADAPSGVRLLCTALGAAIPALVMGEGPWQGARTALAFVISGAALFIAYGGLTIFAFASHQPSALPLPPQLPDPSDGQTTTKTTTTTTTTTTSGPGIAVSPDTLHCDINGCDDSVTITSTGDKVLRIRNIEFDPSTFGFALAQDDGCEWHDLEQDEQCQVSVTFVPPESAGTYNATMLIHQNLPGEPTSVALEGTVEEPKTAALAFELNLVGSVPFADRYEVDVSIDDTEYKNGFCGFGDASTRCLSTTLYTWELPSVPVGAKLNWQFTWTGLSTSALAEGQSTLTQGTTIAVTCTYTGSQTTPTCVRTK